MTRDELLAYCLAEPGAWHDEPWAGYGVAKVGAKIFAFNGDEVGGVKMGSGGEEAVEALHCGTG